MRKFESNNKPSTNKPLNTVQDKEPETMDFLANDTKYLRAKERVAQVRKFYSSLLSYAVFISFLAGLNYYIDQWDHPWFLWAAFGWGIGLLFQAAKAFSLESLFLGRDWEARKIKQFMNEEDRTEKWD
ncbi:2TM domain-containing protein [Aggregatimonas sangjinii]|nr:2TM domain-containing protein [Aggregatimonas sangjinii]